MDLESRNKFQPRGPLSVVAGKVPLEVGVEVTEFRKIGLMVGVFVLAARDGFEREGAGMRLRGIVEGPRLNVLTCMAMASLSSLLAWYMPIRSLCMFNIIPSYKSCRRW